MTCFCSLKGDSYSLPKKKFFFFFLLFYSGTQYEPNCNSGLQGHAPVQTDSPTWNCQSPEPVWLSPSTCRVWEGGVRGGPGLRLCPWAGAEAGFAGTWPWAPNLQWFWLQKLLHDTLSFYSLIISFANCCIRGFSPQQHYLPPAVENFALIWMLFVLRHTPWLSSILRQMMKKNWNMGFLQEEHLRGIKPNTYSEEMSVRHPK